MFSGKIKWEKLRVPLVYAVYLTVTLLLQSLLFSRLSFFGVKGFILPAAAVAAGMYLGGVRGAVFGLCLGVLSDLGFTESTVLYTLLFTFIGFTVGFMAEFYLNNSFFAYMLFSVLALFLTGFIQLLCAMILHGAEFFPGLGVVILQVLISVLPVMLMFLPFRNMPSIGRQ